MKKRVGKELRATLTQAGLLVHSAFAEKLLAEEMVRGVFSQLSVCASAFCHFSVDTLAGGGCGTQGAPCAGHCDEREEE